MYDKNLKIDELRACFDRENARKESLQNKASYFLGVISIIVTIICTFISISRININFNSCFSISLVILVFISFLFSIVPCLLVIFPKSYTHPFSFKNYKSFENSFKQDNEIFERGLYNQYLISIYTNHKQNDKLITNIYISIVSFVCFIILFILMVIFA